MKQPHTKKSGAALVIALGFLAILTITIIAFTAQTRTERLAGRAYLTTAQTRQLLSTALSRSMEDIDIACENSIYPPFNCLGSLSEERLDPLLFNSVTFNVETNYLPLGNRAIANDFIDVLQKQAQWQEVTNANHEIVGRIGYIIVNTSGLLDANAVGDYYTASNGVAYVERKRGDSPREIQLSPDLIAELGVESKYPLHMGTPNAGTAQDAATAFVFNRKNAWHRFESLRDLAILNTTDVVNPPILVSHPGSFRTFSYFPSDMDDANFMGDHIENFQEGAVRDALNEIGVEGINQDFVIEQLKDYIDEDSDAADPYYSVEPVPLINEILLDCVFEFTPIIEEVTPEELDEDGNVVTNAENDVVAVAITNNYSLEIEVWFPFAGQTNLNEYTIEILQAESSLSADLFGDVGAWIGSELELKGPWEPGDVRTGVIVNDIATSDDSLTQEDAVAAFSGISGVIDQFSLTSLNEAEIPVDLAENLELPIDSAGALIEERAMNILNYLFEDAIELEEEPETTNFTFQIGLATIDPRLNWDGTNRNHWVETGDSGYGDSMGAVNKGIIGEYIEKMEGRPIDEPDDIIHVRNEGLINSPYEFTYLLPDVNRPWYTFQFFKENETGKLEAHRLTDLLTAGQRERTRQGWVNPNSKEINVLASALLQMPIDTLVSDNVSSAPRLDLNNAIGLAAMILAEGPYQVRSEVIQGLPYTDISNVIGGSTPWENESVLRNAMNLFDVRDNTFTILLVAQSGTDANADGSLDSDEIRSTQKAVADVWRDPQSGESACVFWGLSDTLQNVGSDNWSTILQAFNPEL